MAAIQSSLINVTVTNNDTVSVQNNGFDLPVTGLDDGTFYYIHIPAIVLLTCSMACAIVSVTLSFRTHSYRRFYSHWSKSERFIIYMAICDGMLNLYCILGHTHMVVTKFHVQPEDLCFFYGFNRIVFSSAQILMVNCVAINAFMLLYCNKKLKFGKYDWKLLVWAFGVPSIGAAIAWYTKQLGPSGTLCYFDGINGVLAFVCFATVPLLIVLTVNIILYILTWNRIHDQTKAIRESSSHLPTSSRHAAKAMLLFVLAFFVHWAPLGAYGMWALFSGVPRPVLHIVLIFTYIGGCLNLAVFLIIRRKHLDDGTSSNFKSYIRKEGPTASRGGL